jgi:glycosyltransferase involved in cell wall biosynthesis
MKKLIIQIPCYNEQDTLPITLRDLPRELPGISKVEWLIVDDGSNDDTIRVARECGVDHIVRHFNNLGLARAFATGLDAALSLGADIIVNTDADNQYDARDIPVLIQPILEGKADIVIGERPIATISHFSGVKKLLQRLGSYVVRVASSTSVPDAPSGFRAMSRDAAMQTHVFSEHTYTLETIIQAGRRGLSIASVPIRTNPDLRKSRLISSMLNYVARSALTILRIFMTYKPLAFFAVLGEVFLAAGVFLGLRFLYLYMTGGGAGHVQSLLLTVVLLNAGFLLIVFGFLADLISVNRKLLERIDFRLYRLSDEEKRRGDARH